MDSFEDCGLSAELIEALSSEGFERPTPIQEAAIPVLRRGNNLLVAAAPGAGTLIAWASALLDRLEPGSAGPSGLVLTATTEAARAHAEALQRLSFSTGHRIGALGTPWALPERSDVLVGTPDDVAAAARAGTLDLSGVDALVVDQTDRIDRLGGLGAVEVVIEFLPKEGQRIVVALPVTDAVEDFVERHARRAARIPPPSDGSSPKRGTLRFRVVTEPKDDGLLATVAELLEGEARHVLVCFRTEDRAADLGDHLALHGFTTGAPGDPDAPVWLGVHDLEARSAAEGVDGVVVLSCDMPVGPDAMDRRHGLNGGGIVLALPREMTHLRDTARRTGYGLDAFPLPRSAPDEAARFRETLAAAIETEDAAPYLLLLEPLFERFDPTEVAAAAAALLRKKAPAAAPTAGTRPSRSGPERPAPTTWVKLFLSVGERDGLTAKDLLGAITGEANVQGSRVGKIEIRESHSVVEVEEPIARAVIGALNGTTIRGRAVRADFDRGRGRSSQPRGRGSRRT